LLTERSIINFLVWIAGMIAGPYLVGATLSGNLVPILVLAAICLLIFMFGIGRDKLCLLPLLGTFIPGKLTFLPFQLGFSDICAIALLVYYLITYTALQRRSMHIGPLVFFIPIVAFAAIILSHEPSFGLRSLGTGQEGGRVAILIQVAAFAYICGVSVDSIPPRFLNRFPLYCVAGTLLASIPFFITTIKPGLAPYFYLVTDYINKSAYMSDVLNSGNIVENGGQAVSGITIAAFLLSYYPITTWWRPGRWWVPALMLLAFGLVLIGGYRNYLVTFAVTAIVATWCHYSWRSLFFAPFFLLAAALLGSMNDSHFIHLPIPAQRTLSFLPGNWDPEVIESAKGSNEFRNRIIDVYRTEYAHKSPLLGNGTSYDSEEFARLNFLMETHETSDGYYQSKAFITGKMFHNGWISVYDSVGVIGFGCFATLGLSLTWKCWWMVFGRGVDRKSILFPFKIWLLTNVFSTFFAFFTVYGDIKLGFPFLCFSAVAWTQVDRLERQGYKNVPSVREVPFDAARSGLPVPV
jgi:hypothetical protein